MELLPPALIGLLIAYGKWTQQDRAVQVGTVLIAAIAPVAVMAVIEIDDASTFSVILACIGISAIAAARHVPWNSRLALANLAFFGFGVCGAIALNIPDSIQPDETARVIRVSFSWATLALLIISAVLYFLVNIRRSVALSTYFALSIGTVLVLWTVVLQPIHANHTVIGTVLAYALIALLGVAPTGILVARDHLKKATVSRKP